VAAATMIVGTVVGVAQYQRQADARVLEHRALAATAPRAVSGNDLGKGAVAFLPADLCLTNIGAFGVIVLLEIAIGRTTRSPTTPVSARSSRSCRADDDFPALARRFPADGGLHREVVRVSAAIKSGFVWLAIIGVLTKRRLGVFYLRIIVIDVHDPSSETIARFRPCRRSPAPHSSSPLIAIVYLGILPTRS